MACVQFGEEELGSAASSEEFADVMKQLYGAAGGRPGKRVFAESAEQLDLEENPDPKSPLAPRAALTTVTPQQAAAPAGPSTANGVPKDPLAALDARLGGRMAAGAVTQTGFGGGPAAEGAAAPAARKGIVARRADAELMPPPPSAGKPLVPAAKRLAVETVQPSRGAGSRAAPQSAVVLSAPEPRATIRVMLGTTTPLIGSGSIPHELHVANKPGAGGTSVAEVCLMHGDQPAWNDALPSAVIAATGTTAFSAVATADGHLIMYTPAGRRKAPPLRLGAGIEHR